MRKYIIGIDEAGRGPLAGPVAVGLVLARDNFDWDTIPGVADSKKLTEKKREAVFQKAQELRRAGALECYVSMVSAPVIDRVGITHAVRLGIERTLKKIDVPPQEIEVRLDGLLRAPASYTYQKTITKGDEKEKVIGLASILAKVTRDRHMIRLATRYPLYDFELHKGYGTHAHRAMIKKHGLSAAHRKSFCRSLSASKST